MLDKHCEMKVHRFKVQGKEQTAIEIKITPFKVPRFKVPPFKVPRFKAGSQEIKMHSKAESQEMKVPRFKVQGKDSRLKVEQMVVQMVMVCGKVKSKVQRSNDQKRQFR